MSFSEETTKQAWNRSGGECENANCDTSLPWESRGSEVAGGWEAHHIQSVESGGSDNLSNCQILCQPCYKKTHTYGG